jgi:hypothetical protein
MSQGAKRDSIATPAAAAVAVPVSVDKDVSRMPPEEYLGSCDFVTILT